MFTTAMQHLAVWVRSQIDRIDRNDRAPRGSSIVEYALLVTLIAVVCLLALNYLGETTSDSYSQFATSLAAAN